MLSKAKKKIIQHSWHQVEHSVCGYVTTVKVWMGHHCDLYTHKKRPDALSRYLEDVFYPVVSSQGLMVKNPAGGITHKKLINVGGN